MSGPTAAMTPVLDQDVGPAGTVASTTVPPLIATAAGARGGPVTSRRGKVDPRSEQQVEHRHPHGDAVGDLVGDHR